MRSKPPGRVVVPGESKQQLRKIAAVEGNLRGVPVVHHLPDYGIFGLQHCRLAAHGDGIGYRAHFEHDVHARLLIDLQHDAGSGLLLEARRLRR